MSKYSPGFLVFPRAKNIRSDADHRGPVPDGDGPIARHADGQLREGFPQLRMLLPDSVEQRLDPGEIRLDHPFILRIGRHAHETPDPDAPKLRKHTL